MLKLIKGAKVNNADSLYPGYKVEPNHITASVDADKIIDVFNHFIIDHEEQGLFFFLELPENERNLMLRSHNVIHSDTKNIYYLDALNTEQALTILIRDGELLANDGISSFGFGCPEAGDEIGKYSYNLISIYSEDVARYEGFFEQHGMSRNDNLVTVSSTLSMSNPGLSERITVNGLTVFDLPEKYADWGMYLGERRDDDGIVIEDDEFEGYELRYYERLKPGKSRIATLGDLYDVLQLCWRKETAYPSAQSDWDEDCPSWGQCAITAMLVYDMFGGEIYRTPDHSHYYNKIEDHWVDLTARQFWDFGNCCDYDAGEKIERKHLGQSGHTRDRYLMLVENIREFLENEELK